MDYIYFIKNIKYELHISGLVQPPHASNTECSRRLQNVLEGSRTILERPRFTN